MKEKVKEVFNRLADVYEKTVDTKSPYNCEYERPAMMNQLPTDLAGKTILDAGCAAGWYTQQFINRGATVVAIDMSPEMVQATSRRVGEKAQVLCLDPEDQLLLENNTFDYIVSSLTLHYLFDWIQTFREFTRILKPGGTFLFSIHHPFTDIRLLPDPQYFATEPILDTWKKEEKVYQVPFYRRSLQSILNTTLTYFSIEKFTEPIPTMKFKDEKPKEYDQLLRNPQFLIIKAKNVEK